MCRKSFRLRLRPENELFWFSGSGRKMGILLPEKCNFFIKISQYFTLKFFKFLKIFLKIF